MGPFLFRNGDSELRAGAPAPAHDVGRPLGFAAVGLLLVLVFPVLLPDGARASADGIVPETVLAERAWTARPDVPFHRAVEFSIRNLPALHACTAAHQERADVLAALRPGTTTPLAVRWVVEDGYYIGAEQPSTLEFQNTAHLAILPQKLATAGKVMGEFEQSATLSVAKGAPSGRREVSAKATVYFCSIREQLCRRTTRTLRLVVVVDSKAALPAPAIDLPIVVPPEER